MGIDAQRSRILVNPCQQDYTRRWGYRETRKKTGGEKCTRRGYIYIYKGGRVEKILAGFSLPSAVLPCHILLPFSSSLLSSSSSSSTSLHDYLLLATPSSSFARRDTFSTTTPLMKFLYYFNKRYLPLSDRYSSAAALCRGMGTRFNLASLRHFRENAPAYVSSRRI